MAKGLNIPKHLRKDIDQLKDDTVNEIFQEGNKIMQSLSNFKTNSFESIETYMQILGEQYNIEYSGKGNLTLTNYNKTKKVVRAVHDFIVFDEKLQIAKSLIDKCIHKWSNGANENIKVLVEHAFEVDKQGKVSTERVLGLRRLKIDDETWTEAMKAITDSLSTTGSRSYIRLYERLDEYATWKQISLNLSNVGD